MTENIKVTLAAKLDITEETKQKIENFTKALNELPTSLNIRLAIDGVETGTPLKFSIADLLIDQVKEHFCKNS